MLLSFLVLCLSPLALAQPFSPADVSILLPLPERKEDHARMLAPLSGDVLLPLRVFQAMPRIVLDLSPRQVYEEALRVVAVRIDPCFREKDEAPCQRQIRLVWQPLVFEENEWTTLDAAFHTFHEVRDWDALRKDLAPLHVASDSVGVHPVLQKEGYAGPFWEKLSALLRKYCNPVTLRRATIMAVNPLGNVWFFTGVDVRGSGELFSKMKIPRLRDDEPVQGFITSLDSRNATEFRAAMNPAPEGVPGYLAMLRDSKGSPAKLGEEKIVEATRLALRMENPALTNPGNTDCVSCHTAHLIPEWSLRNFPSWNWKSLFSAELFSESLPITDSGFGPNVLRSFGYFGTKPVISRRVRYETMESLKLMNR